jgi:hypothetical protein
MQGALLHTYIDPATGKPAIDAAGKELYALL